MGFVDRGGPASYVNIIRGQFAYKEGDQKILTDQALSGTLIDIEIVDDEYNNKKYKKLCLKLDDGSKVLQLQMKMGSGYANAFCMMIQNADLTKPLVFSPTYDEPNGKPKTGMFINQDGKALKWFYTKNDPKNLPQLEKVEFRGETMWDNLKQQEFLTDLLLNKIKPQLVHPVLAGAATQTGGTSPARSLSPAADITEPIDDLPF